MTRPLVLQLAPGDAFSGSDFIFRVSGAPAEDLVLALREGGFDAEIPISHSADRQGVDVLVTLVKAGGLAGLATLLATFLARHEKKSVVLKDGTTVTGYSAEDVKKILETLHGPIEDLPALPDTE